MSYDLNENTFERIHTEYQPVGSFELYAVGLDPNWHVRCWYGLVSAKAMVTVLTNA